MMKKRSGYAHITMFEISKIDFFSTRQPPYGLPRIMPAKTAVIIADEPAAM